MNSYGRQRGVNKAQQHLFKSLYSLDNSWFGNVNIGSNKEGAAPTTLGKQHPNNTPTTITFFFYKVRVQHNNCASLFPSSSERERECWGVVVAMATEGKVITCKGISLLFSFKEWVLLQTHKSSITYHLLWLWGCWERAVHHGSLLWWPSAWRSYCCQL